MISLQNRQPQQEFYHFGQTPLDKISLKNKVYLGWANAHSRFFLPRNTLNTLKIFRMSRG